MPFFGARKNRMPDSERPALRCKVKNSFQKGVIASLDTSVRTDLNLYRTTLCGAAAKPVKISGYLSSKSISKGWSAVPLPE